MDSVCRKHSSHTTQQWSDDTGDTPDATEEACILATVLEGDDVRNDDLHELDNSSTADTLNSPRDDEPDDTLGSST